MRGTATSINVTLDQLLVQGRSRLAPLSGLCVAVAACLLTTLVILGARPGLAWGQSTSKTLTDNVPAPVAHRLTRSRGARSARTPMTLNVDLAVREDAQLKSLIAAASMPGNPGYGHYLTQAQYKARFAPTSGERDAVERWLRGGGLRVTGASPDNLLVHVSGSTAAVERAFVVAVNNYSYQGRQFYANDRSPSAPSYLHVESIAGLSTYLQFQAANPKHCSNGVEPVVCAFGSDFRTAYDLIGNGEGQTIGFTLWGEEVPQSDYNKYATDTGTTALTVGGAGNDHLQFIQVGGASTINEKGEVALDTEVAHAVAPGIHETYWLGHNSETTTLETVVNDAANSAISVISNSWGAVGTNSCAPLPAGLESSLEHGAATGKTFYFSTGDRGASEGCHLPSSSRYVVAVGGTDLEFGSSSEWKSEKAIKDNGGCTNSEPRPAWQTGIGSPLEYPSTACSGRATPDVSADSCYSGEETFPSGECPAFDYVEGAVHIAGGTSLSAPLWAAGSVVWNRNNAAAGRPAIGFVAPLLYTLGNDSTTYANDFHDITTGSNGFAATTGWDEATGWGTPIFNNLANNAADISYTGATSAVEGETKTLSAKLVDHGTTHGLAGKPIKFTVGAESCEEVTNSSGEASCKVTIKDAAGSYTVSAKFSGDVAYTAVSASHSFTVEPAVSKPTVTKIEPKEGSAAGGDHVTITGTNFTGAKAVKFGTVGATSFEVKSATEIKAVSPAGTAGTTVQVTVETAGGTSATSSADEFKYVAAGCVALKVETSTLPDATRGIAYKAELVACGGVAPYKWKKTGPLPKGVKLSKTGVIAGTPSKKLAPGSYPVGVNVTDSKKHAATASLTLKVN